MRKQLIFTLSVLLFISCGKSKEEIELEKAKIDLEKTKLELFKEKENTKSDNDNVIEEKNKELQNLHEQKILVGINKRKQKFNESLTNLKIELEKAKKNYNSINNFQLGRSTTTKERQLSEASQKIYQIETTINGIQDALTELELKQTFAFQDNPKKLIDYLFKSAKNKDFINFQFLVDPYAENSNSIERISFIKYLPIETQESFLTEFSNCRVMGSPKINGDKVEIEYAYGENSNKLETMTLIKRFDKWYLFAN